MTTRDNEILEVLTHRLRILSMKQIAYAWWNGVIASAHRRVSALEEQGWLTTGNALAQPPPTMPSPIASWKPQSDAPDFGSVSHRLRERWAVPLERTTIVSATGRAAAAFAGWGGRMPRVSELAHDLALAELFLFFRRELPSRAKGWRCEASLHAEGFGRDDNLPDAMIVSRKERTVIELGGSYPKKKLLDFHEACEARELAYEIW